MKINGEVVEGAVLTTLVVVGGLMDLVFHPRKTYNLVVHKVGWYD